jgi:class 3 adenylate cyclase/tetratricopeptide (TPR) repeat protein
VPSEPEVRKTVTVLFTDVTGSTSLGESLDLEALRRVMSRYFEEMRGVIERHGGRVEKFIGDAVVAAFGVPLVREDDALRAVRAAAEMRKRLGTLNEELERDRGVRIQVRTGVNTGEVMTGGTTEGVLATGDPMNVAARLEQAASPGEILLADSTYRLVKDAVAVAEAGALELKGKARPVRAWRLLDVAAEAPGVARRLTSPIVGRGKELSLLRAAFDRASAERACHLVTVIGEAGLGKSRLTLEFTGGLGDRATVARARCLAYGEGITFWPLAEAVKQASGITQEDEAGEAEAKIEALIAGDPDAAAVAEHVASAIGLTDAAYSIQETFWAVRRLFEAVARTRPLVVEFDDIHWGEPTFLDLLEYLAGWSTGSPILLLCMARPDLLDLRPAWGAGKQNVTSIRLDPLTAEESDSVMENLLNGAELGPEARARITEAAEGNPLFVEEILRMLVDEGVLQRDDGRWSAVGDLSSLSIPPTVNALLDARLEGLPAEERAVLQRASVVGKVFWWGAVSELSPQEEQPIVGTLLQALVRRELIHPDRSSFTGEDAFRFGHILIRDAAYRGVPKEARANLHGQLARWLEFRAGDRVSEYEEILGYHLEQSCRYRSELGPVGKEDRQLTVEAARWLASAGRRALARNDIPATINLLTRAAALPPANDPTRLGILSDLATALSEAGDEQQARALFAEALQRAEASGDDRLRAHAAMQRWLALGEGGSELAEARREAEEALHVFEAVGDERGLSRAWRLRGATDWWAGRIGAEERAIDRALRHARNAGDAREEAEIFFTLSRDLVRGPTAVDQGIERCEKVLAGTGGNRTIEGYMFHALAHLRARRGEFEEALSMAERFRGILRENGQMMSFWFFAEVPGDIMMLADDPHGAVDVLTEGYEHLEQMGDRDPLLAALLAEASYANGQFEEAERKAELAASSSIPLSRNLGKGVLSKVRARQGRPEEAERMGREAVASFEGTDFLIDHATSLMALGEVLRLAGRMEEAASAVRDALDLFDHKGDIVSAGKARSAIRGLIGENSR